MTTHTYWASIGRNVAPGKLRPAGPLADDQWNWFASDLRSVVTNHDGTILAEVTGGRSTWEGESEETYLLLFTAPDSHAVEIIRAVFASIARYYCQDCIGLVGGPGTDTLVYA